MDIVQQIHFESAIKIGDKVHAFWTNYGWRFHADGTIADINRCSFVVKLSHGVRAHPLGKMIRIPRCLKPHWSRNNCLTMCSDPKVKEFLCAQQTHTSPKKTRNTARRPSSSAPSEPLLF